MHPKIFLKILCITLLSTACGEDSERPEAVNKLRGLGVAQSKAAASAGDTVRLTFYWAAPKGKKTTVTPYVDKQSNYAEPATVQLVDAVPAETNYGAISVYTLPADVTIPSSSDVLTKQLIAYGTGRVRYGIRVTSDDGDDEILVGDTLVANKDNPILDFVSALPLDVPSPSTNQSVNKGDTVELATTIQTNPDEQVRVGWYVSSGKVKSRRARTTEWTDFDSGEQTVIVTVRGRKSGSFNLKAIKVNAN